MNKLACALWRCHPNLQIKCIAQAPPKQMDGCQVCMDSACDNTFFPHYYSRKHKYAENYIIHESSNPAKWIDKPVSVHVIS